MRKKYGKKKVWKKKYAKKKKYGVKKSGKHGCACAHPFGVTSNSPIGHAQWYLYYSTKCGKNDVTEEKTRGEMTSRKKKRGKNDVTSCDVASGWGHFRSRD